MKMNFSIYKDEFMNETLYSATHSTGLSVYIMPKPGYSQCEAMFATRFGSIDNEFSLMGNDARIRIPDGTAHFLEHKLFDEEDGNVFDKFSALGANANAFTSFGLTAYYFSATDNFLESLGVLVKFVQSPYFTPDSIAKEQGIIGQEIRMYEDNPNWRVFFNMLGAMYHNNCVKYDIAGTVESIAEIDDKVLYDAYNTFYHPSNMVLFIVGDVDVTQVGECVENSLKDIPPLSGEIGRVYPDEPASVASAYVEQKLSVAMPLFMIGFKDNDMNLTGDALLKKDITTQILGEMLFGKSTALYKSLYEQGLINDSFSAGNSCNAKYSFYGIEGESKDPKAVFEAVLKCAEGAALDEEAFNRAKRVIWGLYVRCFNSPSGIAHVFVNSNVIGVDIFHHQQVYNTITLQDVRERLLSQLRREYAVLSVVDPI